MGKDDGLIDPRLGKRLISASRLARDEKRVERAIKGALAKHKKMAIAALRSQHLTAAAPVDPFATVVWDQSVDDDVVPLIGTVMKDLADSTARFLQLPPAIRSQILGQIDVQARTENFANKVRSIGSDVSGRLMDELQIGVAEGESIDKLTNRINDVFDIGDNIAERIARTEVHGASEGTSFTSANAINNAGYNVNKEWVSTEDSRTRPAHADADGQVVDINDAFDVDGEELMYPGDPDGSAENTVNCRCSTVYSMPDQGEDSDVPPSDYEGIESEPDYGPADDSDLPPSDYSGIANESDAPDSVDQSE